MPKRYRELWYALVAIVAITAIYLVAYQRAGSFPAAYSLVGHGIGVLGFILMLMTETLYSIRKQTTDARWGSMAGWLRFHMVTGIVGPYMVLLHTAMRFRGLAGVVMLLTIVVALSGLIGRYIYTAVPRAIDGTELEVSTLDRRIARAEVTLMGSTGIEAASAVAVAPSPLGTDQAGETQALVARRQSLDRRLHRLAAERGALAAWRSIHVPLTWVLFVTALVHIVAAVYYATLLR
jgi:hypothetical protein